MYIITNCLKSNNSLTLLNSKNMSILHIFAVNRGKYRKPENIKEQTKRPRCIL